MPQRRLGVYSSNCLHELLRALVGRLRDHPLPPHVRETIVVPSHALRRWLRLRLAAPAARGGLGVAAHLDLPLPAEFCRRLASGPRRPGDGDPFDRDPLLWRLFRLLGDLDGDARLAPLRAYLAGDGDQRRRYQLAARIAGRFDDYQVFRPDLLQRWEDGGDEDQSADRWQPELWRRLVAEADAPHHGELLLRAGQGVFAVAPPPRVALFAPGALPPRFWGVIGALADHAPVDVYLPVPTPHYVGDLPAGRTRGPDADDGHPLLVAFGRLGRDQSELLLDLDPTGSAWNALPFRDPAGGDGPPTALAALQSDVCELRAPGRDPRHTLREGDDSLRIHACHSPRREVEVLRDRLYDWFERDPGLRPDDIAVLVPDLATYGPLLRAVLGAPPPGLPPLPFALADGDDPEGDAVLSAFADVLRLAGSRLRRADVLALLDRAPVRRRFGIAAERLPAIHEWVQRAGIRWGADAAQREGNSGAAIGDGNTWRFGLDRLLLGYATGPADGLVAGRAPHADATAANADLLGGFAAFAETVLRLAMALGHAQPAARHAALWRDVAANVLAPDTPAEHDAHARLLAAIAAFESSTAAAGGAEPIAPAAAAGHLLGVLQREPDARAFVTGAITVSSLRPLRTVPFRIVCVLGLDDGVFPRADRPLPFDRIARRPRRGDRSLRDDDRWLFLETLLAAEEKLHLSHVGRSEVDDAELQPSLCLAELLDVAERTFAVAGGTVHGALVVRHPLHAFSARHFDGSDPRLFSFASDLCAAGAAAAGERAPPRPFFTGPLPSQAPRRVAAADLIAFVQNPARWFCREVLELRLPEREEVPSDDEPLVLDGLGRWLVRDRLLRLALAGGEPEGLRAEGLLPVGAPGDLQLELRSAEAEPIAALLRGVRFEPPRAFEVAVDGTALHGALAGLAADARYAWRAGRVRNQDLLDAWVTHLLLQLVAGAPRTTELCGYDRRVRIEPREDAADRLAELLDLFHRGHAEPLPLFPEASRAWAASVAAGKPKPGDARAAFAGGQRSPLADRDDPHVALCWRDRDPFEDGRFAQLAERVWLPILGAQGAVSG